MYSVKALLFDLDGTLLDSKKAVVQAVYQTANHYVPGKFSYMDIEARFGEAMESFIPLLGCFDKGEVMDTYLKFIRENQDTLVAPFPNVIENIVILCNEGYKLGVVTNKQRNLTLHCLRLWEMDSLFDTIITIDDVNNGKPHPEPIARACQELNVGEREVLMIGDTLYDVKAAHAAGVRCAIIDWYRSYPILEWVPDLYLHDINELIELLISSQKR